MRDDEEKCYVAGMRLIDLYSMTTGGLSIVANVAQTRLIRALGQEAKYGHLAGQGKIALFLNRFPEYRKTLTLAATHEESSGEAPTYQGWQWHDVETHPTKLLRLVTEGIARVALKTRRATYYVLKDRETIKRYLAVDPREE